MKKRLSLLLALALLVGLSDGIALSAAEELPAVLPANMPETYLEYRQVAGTETKGVTFVVNETAWDGNALTIIVTQLPNDDFTALVDNQVEYPPEDTDFHKEVEAASQYGRTVLGTLCDILALTDEKGENLLYQYKVSPIRDDASPIYEFTVFLPPENTAQEINVELVVGVNEDLGCRFPASDNILLTIPIVPSKTEEE